MTISSLALAAKKVIDAAWLHGDSCDLSSQAAFALESAGLLQSPETAAELEHLRAQQRAVPYVLGESTIPKDLREQLVALLTEMLRQGVPCPALTGGMQAQGEMEAALSGALARKMYPAPGLFPSAATQVHQLRVRVAELEKERHTTNEALDDAGQALRTGQAQRAALTERLRAGQRWQRGRNPELVSENFVSQSELRSIFGIPLVAPWAADESVQSGGA